MWLLFFSAFVQAQDLQEYDELNVEMNIPRLGNFEIPVAIKGEHAFILPESLFDLLKIKHEETSKGLSGFIVHPDSTYQINWQGPTVTYSGAIFDIPPSHVILTNTGNYLRADYFGKIFGLNADFSFRSLSFKMETQKELPVLKEMRLLKMRDNLNRVKGVIMPDTIMARRYPFFKPGTLDWEL